MLGAAPTTSADPPSPQRTTLRRPCRAAQFWMKWGDPLKPVTPTSVAIVRVRAYKRPPDTGRCRLPTRCKVLYQAHKACEMLLK